MKVSAEDVNYIAQLSRLNVPETELEIFTEQFNQILNYADILQKTFFAASFQPFSTTFNHFNYIVNHFH